MYPSLSQPMSMPYPPSSSSTKKSKCYKCNTPLQIPISQCLIQCQQCGRFNLFVCHIIPKQANINKQKIVCKQCKNSYAVINCPRCRGFSAIRDFMNGFGYQCSCGLKCIYVGCPECKEMLGLPAGRDYQKVLINCKACENQFSYKICNSCRNCIYKKKSDTSELYLCNNEKCPQSGTGQHNIFGNKDNTGLNPYGFLPEAEPQNQQMKYRITQFQEQSKNMNNPANTGNTGNNTDNKQMYKDLCKVCMVNQANMINVSCYHLSICQQCAADIQKKQNGRCPVCRTQGKYQRVFKS